MRRCRSGAGGKLPGVRPRRARLAVAVPSYLPAVQREGEAVAVPSCLLTVRLGAVAVPSCLLTVRRGAVAVPSCLLTVRRGAGAGSNGRPGLPHAARSTPTTPDGGIRLGREFDPRERGIEQWLASHPWGRARPGFPRTHYESAGPGFLSWIPVQAAPRPHVVVA